MNRLFVGAIVVMLTLVAISWTGITVYDSVATVEVTPGVESQLRPIRGTFDSEILGDIEARTGELNFPPEELLKLETEE